MTRRQRQVLERLAKGEELVYERGVGYVGDDCEDPVSGRTVYALLRLCAIKHAAYSDTRPGGFERFEITGTGRDLLENEEKATENLRRLFKKARKTK